MRWALARAFGPERGEASWAGRGEKLLGCRCENGPRGKVWAGLFGLEEEVGQAGLVSGFWGLGLLLFLFQTKLTLFEFKFEFEFKPHSIK